MRTVADLIEPYAGVSRRVEVLMLCSSYENIKMTTCQYKHFVVSLVLLKLLTVVGGLSYGAGF